MIIRTISFFAVAFSLTACVNANSGRENTQTYVDSFRPTMVQYASDPLSFYQGITITPQVPSIAAKKKITSCMSVPTLPSGLTLDNLTCKISGTPTTVQVATPYTITATNDMGSLSVQVNILIATPPPSNLVYSGGPFSFVKSKAITAVTPTFTSTVTSCSASPALPGLTLDNTTCAISGTPTSSQLQTTHTITASNAFGSTQTTIDLTIFRILFATQAGIAGHLMTTSSVADNHCNIDSNNNQTGTGPYKAMIVGWGTRRACSTTNCTTSGIAENLDWVLAPSTEYRRTDLTTKIMTTNSAGIFVFGALSAAIDSSGGTASWTGLGTDWVMYVNGTCGGNWSTAGASGASGNVKATTNQVLWQVTGGPCSSSPNRLVCAQQ